MPDVHLLANPQANGGRRPSRAHDVVACLEAVGATVHLLEATSVDQSRQALRSVQRLHNPRVVLVGGDGLVHLALDELAGSGAEVGLIPTGTGNDFAHALGLDEGDVRAQVARALAPSRPLDAIRTDHGWVASVATLGFSAAVNARANAMTWPRGSTRYTMATLRELRRLRPVRVILELDDRTVETDTALLAVANTAYFGGGMAICPAARPDDAMLDVAVIDDLRAGQLLRVFPRVFRGTHVADPRCTMYRSRRVRITATADVWGDGEFVGPAPITCEVVPAALRWAGVQAPETR